MTRWIAVFKIERERKGVKEITMWFLNEEYKPLRKAVRTLLERMTKELKTQ